MFYFSLVYISNDSARKESLLEMVLQAISLYKVTISSCKLVLYFFKCCVAPAECCFKLTNNRGNSLFVHFHCSLLCLFILISSIISLVFSLHFISLVLLNHFKIITRNPTSLNQPPRPSFGFLLLIYTLLYSFTLVLLIAFKIITRNPTSLNQPPRPHLDSCFCLTHILIHFLWFS